MAEKKICPGCGRHCNLNEPCCEKGEEYLRSGKLPARQEGEGHRHEKRMQYDHNANMTDKLVIRLRDISHMMRRQYEGKASQKRILMILHGAGTLTQKALTERLGIQAGSASEILSKLENAGLITRTTNEADRRTTDIQLTDAGVQLALDAAEQRQKRHQEMFSCLSPEEQQTLLSLLEKIQADWEVRFTGSCGHRGEHDAHEHHAKKHRGEDARRED